MFPLSCDSHVAGKAAVDEPGAGLRAWAPGHPRAVQVFAPTGATHERAVAATYPIPLAAARPDKAWNEAARRTCPWEAGGKLLPDLLGK
jgi:hypothetical protein